MPTTFYDYKFKDYYSSLGINEKFIEITGLEDEDFLIAKTTLKPIEKIRDMQENLNRLMLKVAAKFNC